MESLFNQFIREKEFVDDVSVHTLKSYQQSFNTWTELKGVLSDDGIKDFIIAMRRKGLKPTSCNVYIRSLNVFFTWLYENKHTAEHFKIKKLKEEQKVFKVFTDQHIRSILRFKPQDYYEWRMWASVCLLMDTGIRIDEMLKLKMEDVDMDNLILKVKGKGRKERLVPFSVEMRKVLFLFIKKKKSINLNGEWLFPTTVSTAMGYRNYYRDMKIFCIKRGIDGVRISPHTFRHYFAIQFLRNGGDIYVLSRILGHWSVKMTEVYLRSLGMDIIHERRAGLTPLARLR